MIIINEITSHQNHDFTSTLTVIMQVSGQPLLMICYYFSRDWHSINILIGLYSAISLLIALLVLPETPRYLITKKRYEECYKVLKRISQVNKRSDEMFTREEFLSQIESNNNGTIDKAAGEFNFQEIQSLLSIKSKKAFDDNKNNDTEDVEIGEGNSKSLLFFLFNPPKNLILTLAMGLVWCSISLNYFGLGYGKY